MINILSVDNMRKSDAYTIAHHTTGRELMYLAGKGVFEAVKWRSPVAVICGSGNNAGDGYVIAKLLSDAGIGCEIILLSERFSDDGKYYFDICKDAGIPYRSWDKTVDLSRYAALVDCIFGTGFKGEIRGTAKEVIEAINSSGAYTVSVDINSGLNGDNGLAELCVISDVTVSAGGFKSGHFMNMAKDVMKQKVNIDIGIEPVEKPYHLIEANDIKHIFAPRKNYSHKGTYGYTALVGGSRRYQGAVRLAQSANSAMRSGAGVVKLAIPGAIWHVLAPLVLESTLFPLSDDGDRIVFNEDEAKELISNVKTVAFGMGVGTGEGTGRMLEYLLENYTGRFIVDADGLTLLSKTDRGLIKSFGGTLILTPHIKEFSRLTGKEISDILSSPIKYAEEYSKETGAILLLKGPTTVITDGETTYLVDRGCPGMAAAGSGDVLSGILSAVLGFAKDPLLGTAAGAYINGRAGELAESQNGSVGMIASDTVACVRAAVYELEKS